MKNFKTVSVCFVDSYKKEYTYKTDLDVKVGDYCVVPVKMLTPEDEEYWAYKTVYVVDIHEEPQLKPRVVYRWIIQKVDTEKLDYYQQLENND